MQAGHWIAIAIIIIALIVTVLIVMQAKKKISPTLDILNDFNKNVQNQVNHFQSEGAHVQKEVGQLTERVNYLQTNATDKQAKFTQFMNSQEELQNQINYLKEVAPQYAKGYGQAIAEDVKRDVPKISKIMKLAIQKTVNKQKARQSEKEGR